MHYFKKISTFLLLSFSLLSGTVSAQEIQKQGAGLHKLSPSAALALKSETADTSRFLVVAADLASLQDLLTGYGIPPSAVIREIPQANGLLVRLPHGLVKRLIANSDLVTFVDIRATLPVLERAVSGLDLSANKVNLVHARYPELTGNGFALSIKENAFDSTDIDLRSRYLPSPGRDPVVMTHATNVATIAAGSGNSFYTGLGVAPGCNLSSSSFRNLFPDPLEYFSSRGISVQNHSYGVGIENYYGSEARAYDEQLTTTTAPLAHVFSAGNQGEASGETGPYAEVQGYANLTGNMKMAKNVITVGATDTLLQVMGRSSRGPAYDGRVKPELVAFGQDGTSGAAAITSGALLLLQQAYQRQNAELPSASLLRAVTLNSADDIGNAGPDFSAGYGNLDVYGAVQTIREERYFEGSVQNGETAFYDLPIPPNVQQAKITLAWTDPAAELNSPLALINDLDLTVSSNNSARLHLPLVLSSFPHADSLAREARPGIDRLNNQEQVVITNPTESNYRVAVRGFGISTGSQRFSVAYEWETSGFGWAFPLREDPVEAGATRALRWYGPITGTGDIAYRYVDGGEWRGLAERQNLASEKLLWSVPSDPGRAQLRMTIAGEVFLSDTFLISRAPDLSLLLDCTDELGLGWSNNENEEAYRLFGLREDSMVELLNTPDDYILLNREDYPYGFFSLATLFPGNRSGIRSPALNVAFQSAGCYQEQFFAEAEAAAVGLELRLGLLDGISRVVFEKLGGSGFQEISSVSNPASLTLRAKDLSPSPGLNVYRTKVILEDGGARSGQEASVIYVTDEAFVYPNPTTTEEGAGIILKTLPPGETYFHLYASDGRLLRRFSMLSESEEIPVEDLKQGVYYYRVTSDGGAVASGSLVVQ